MLSKWDPLADTKDMKSTAGEMLRLLANIVAPFRKDTSLPQLDAAVQDALFIAVYARIAHMAKVMDPLVRTPWEKNAVLGSQAVVFLARTLQFHLGFPITWSQKAKDLAGELCLDLTRLALVCNAWDRVVMHLDEGSIDAWRWGGFEHARIPPAYGHFVLYTGW